MNKRTIKSNYDLDEMKATWLEGIQRPHKGSSDVIDFKLAFEYFLFTLFKINYVPFMSGSAPKHRKFLKFSW